MKKILIVDDDAATLDVVEHILVLNDFDVKKYSSGFDILEIVESYCPDLLLLDILLSGKSGRDVCKELKQIYTNLPIILFSVHDIGTDFVLCNADGFLEKPFDIKDLVAMVNLHFTTNTTNIPCTANTVVVNT